MTNTQKKCQAAGGVASCTNPRCPEKQGSLLGNITLPTQFTQLQGLQKPQPPTGGWTNKDTELFRTIHGSRLYGLENRNSDDDFFVVTPNKYVARKLAAKHQIDGDLDTVTVGFYTFKNMVEEGAPQALEAMFSRQAESPYFEAFRQNWFASDPRTVDRYLRTIKSFSLIEEKEEAGSKKWLKHRRHALRLSMNLEELVYTGRFNPTLSPNQVRTVKRLAPLPEEQYLKEVNAVNPFDLDWTYPDYKRES